MAKKRVHFLVEGRVQGVFFRAYTKDFADQQRLVGWVRNLVDGRVEGCIEGEETSVQKMLLWLQRGSPHAVVRKVDYHVIPLGENDDNFEIVSTAAEPASQF